MEYELMTYFTSIIYECYPSYAIKHNNIFINISASEYDALTNRDNNVRKSFFYARLAKENGD